MRRFIMNLLPQLKDIYSPGEVNSRGRLISLISSLVTSFYNVFITGIFYTGFLSMYGISITGVGIVSFIPYIGSLFSLFSPFVLKRFAKRKTVMLSSKLCFYFLFIVATTLMPTFVTDGQARLYWLIGILFVAYAQYALFSPGITVWFYNFYPKENERRTRYIYFNQLFSSVMSSLVLLVSGVITDAVSGSSHQNTIILVLRYFAFFLVMIDVGAQSRATEYPYPDNRSMRLKDVFTVPIKNRKFMMCMLLMFFWNFICNLNNGTWNYHLLNHMGFGYTVINLMSVSYTVLLLVFSKTWRKLLRRFSWVKTFGICCLLSMPVDLMMFMMDWHLRGLYVPLSLWQNVINVGYNLSYANILYMNLPDGDSTSYIAFYSVGANLCAFIGMITGVSIVNLRSDTPFMFLGFEIYTVQLTVLVHVVCLLIMGLMCYFMWRRFTSESEIQLVEVT